ncbi:MAG: FtsQ-type POTRA domain-containing protein [Candidatus Daviesbacteria bacterium]
MKKRKWFILGGTLILVLVLVMLKSPLLSVNLVTIKINQASCINEESLRKELILEGRNILFLNEENLSKTIYAKYLCVKKLTLQRSFPNNIQVQVEGKIAFAKLIPLENITFSNLKELEATPSSSSALVNWSFPTIDKNTGFLVDKDGSIFAQNFESNLPTIFMAEPDLKLGKNLNKDDFNKVATIFEKIFSTDLNFNRTQLVSNYLMVETSPKLIFSLNHDIAHQLASLQLILEKAKIDERMISQVDLRFEKPVVVYTAKNNGKR